MKKEENDKFIINLCLPACLYAFLLSGNLSETLGDEHSHVNNKNIAGT